MNDAASADGSSGGGSGWTEEDVEAAAKELHELATIKKLDEMVKEEHSGYRAYFVETRAEAKAAAADFAGNGEVLEEADRIGGDPPNGMAGATGVDWYYYRDSSTWKRVHDSYGPVIDDLKRCGQYDDGALLTPIVYMDYVIEGLDQGKDLSKAAEKITAAGNDPQNIRSLDITKRIGEDSSWDRISTTAKCLDDWHGHAAQVFHMAYLERLPIILVGQLGIAVALRATLSAAAEVFKGARNDGLKLARMGIDALDAGATDETYGVSTEQMESAAAVLGFVAAVAACAPAGQGVAAAAGLAAAGLTLMAGAAEDEKKDLPEKLQLNAETVDDLMNDVLKQTQQIHEVVSRFQEEAATLLSDLNDLVNSSKNAGVTITPTDDDQGDSIELTLREAFFEPKTPSKDSGHGPGLTTLGGRTTDDDKRNDPTYGELSDKDGLGKAPGGSAYDIAVNLEELWIAGHSYLPGLSDQFSSLAGDLKQAPDGVESALAGPGGDGGSSQSASSRYGAMAAAWASLHAELLTIFQNSTTNLSDVGALLKLAAEAYADQDTAAASELRGLMDDGKLPWE